LNVFNMLWSNNNCWLRSCSHNYPFAHWWNVITIANEVSAFNLTSIWLQRLCSAQRKIYLLHAVCFDVHRKCVVANAYNTVTKIQSSSGWAFWHVLRPVRLAQDFGNVLASSCCARSCSGIVNSSDTFKVIPFELKNRGMCIIISPLFYIYMLFLLTISQKGVHSKAW
jgi:hypothetical protein